MQQKNIFAGQGLSYLYGTETSLPAGYKLGDIRWNDDATKKYRLFYNAGGASIPSNFVFERAFAGAGLYSVTVTTTSETGATAVAGLNEGIKTIPTASYFWGAVYGHPFKVVMATASVGTGVGVCAEATSGGGKCMISTTPSWNCFAYNLGDFASDVTGLATAMTNLAGGRFFIAFEDKPAWYTNKIGK
jgi:hypothetical protein